MPRSQTWTVEALRAAGDDEVVAAFAGHEVREAALQAVLASAQLSGSWAGPSGVVRVVLRDSGPAGREDAWTIRFAPGGVGLAERADPDVQLRLPLLALVRLLTGQADGALLHLAGELEVVGDEELVLALGERLHPAGSTRPVIDPAALDPEAVAAAIDGVRTDHLASVMSGGFRPLVLEQVFGRLPEFLIAEKAAGARVAICFAIGGRHDGAVDRYVVRVTDGTCTVLADAPEGEDVDATLVLDGHEFLRLVLGQLNPVRGVLSGQINVQGHVMKALAFNSIMRIPGS
ncbi:MAG: SCP2 sterol-binding domain-containing protein [Marmoricola sp.]